MNMQEMFEHWYVNFYNVRTGARGRAARHIEKYEGSYISDHAADCFEVWKEAYKLGDSKS